MTALLASLPLLALAAVIASVASHPFDVPEDAGAEGLCAHEPHP